MAVRTTGTVNSRSTWVMVVLAGVVGLVIGGAAGYFGDIGGPDFPLLYFRNNSSAPPFEQMFDGMARFAGLEMSLATCGGTPDRPRAVEAERNLIDLVQANAAKANLAPPLDVARAIVLYRRATIARLHSDQQAFASAVEQERVFLRAAGWRDTSNDHFADVVHDWDGCSSRDGSSPGEKQ